MKSILKGTLALFALLATIALLLGSQPARAQNEPGTGWVEGAVVNEQGDWVRDPYGSNNTSITLSLNGQAIKGRTDGDKNGFYSFRNLKPGVYEVFVDSTFRGNAADQPGNIVYRPVHVLGLVVEANRRTVLNITVHKGKGIEEIGKPVAPTQKAIIISEALAHLQQEIDALKSKQQ